MTITVNSRNFNGTIRKTWKAELLEISGTMVVMIGVFESEVDHVDLGIIRPGTISYEFYWLDRWYNVFRFHEPDGAFRNYYCNLNLPPKFDGAVLDYVDLELDLLADRNGTYVKLDEAEFEESAARYRYSKEILISVDNALYEITGMMERHEFPFDY